MRPAQWKSLLLTLLLLAAAGTPADCTEENVIVDLNTVFYNKMSSEPVILRDRFLDGILTRTVSGRGIIESFRKNKRYGKDLLIIAGYENPEKQQLEVKYHIHAGSDVDTSVLIPGKIIEFRGVFVLHTPLNTGRNRFIFDIILDKESYTIK